ncbi:MAG: hypothetical protein U5J62_08105 [Desulfurivibrio sp.]|nr:hypothetical protein [Desulfurivibrio sp.]
MWQRAQAAEEEEPRRAARDYERLYRQFGQSEHAEEALWRAAELHWQLAAAERDPDWRRVRNLYRRYTAEYPDSHRQDQAYLKLGLAHFQMRFLREALSLGFCPALSRSPLSRAVLAGPPPGEADDRGGHRHF